MFFVYLVFCLTCLVDLTQTQLNTQDDLNKMAAGLRITYDVITNTRETERYDLKIIMENRAVGIVLSEHESWAIHLSHIFILEPGLIGMGGNQTAEVPDQFIRLTHVEGSEFYFQPMPGFGNLKPGGKRAIKLKANFWSVAQTDTMPNWYMTSQDLKPRVIASTRGETLSFVANKNKPSQWKRYSFDEYNPFTVQERYERNFVKSFGKEEIRVIPKPYQMKLGDPETDPRIEIDSTWSIVYQADLTNEMEMLKEKFKISTTHKKDEYTGDGAKTLMLSTDPNLGSANGSDVMNNSESYSLTVNATDKRVTVIGKGSSGAFYGVVTLISLDGEKGVPECSIQDGPRFEYRGIMLDISRNFHGKEEVIHLIKLMGRYKLNKLHLHLTDDEGWRLEIPAFPELTTLGSKRCHDYSETKCLLPQLGSGPDDEAPGSGYLTTGDYKEILREAVKQHVQLIPEFDMPGHARAAIKSMEVRMKKKAPVTPQDDVTLWDVDDTSVYTTPQSYSDNAINPCINSTYNFISILMDQVKNLHKDIQPLKVFHFGGDEVGKGAWDNSTACNKMIADGLVPGDSPKWMFYQRVSGLAKEKDLALAAWEDGLIQEGNQPFNLSSQTSPSSVYAYAWDNVWEWGTAPRAYILANQGYKVVMAHGTHLYFDHPYEPDPEERGYYWATRFTDTKKTFSYNGRDIYANIHTKRSGQPITDEEKCGEDVEKNCPTLKKSDNIMGMQASLFSETTRTKEQLYDRYFPRLLAMAERSWHEAPWEMMDKGEKQSEMMAEDWSSFVRAVGQRELGRLEKESVTYRLPPPGAKLSFGRLLTTAIYPGLEVEYSLDMGQSWTVAGPLVELGDYNYRVWLRTRSMDGRRYSRTVVLDPTITTTYVAQPAIDYIASHVIVNVKVNDNHETYENAYTLTISLKNNGSTTVTKGNWAIFFTAVQWVESASLKKGRPHFNFDAGIYFEHVQGYLFKFGPMDTFTGLEGGRTLNIHVKVDGWSVSRYEQMPNWYVWSPGTMAVNIANTEDEELKFVADFTQPEQWKRSKNDLFSPWTPAARYDRNVERTTPPQAARPILPTPISYKQNTGYASMTTKTWKLWASDKSLKSLAEHFKEFFTMLVPEVKLLIVDSNPASDGIRLTLDPLNHLVNVTNHREAYKVKVDAINSMVEVMAPTMDGLFNGAISLIQLALQPGKEGELAGCDVTDYPRFKYRGLYIDVTRNFKPKENILKILDVMALYKLNKFHVNVANDEGWRLDIPGIPELAQVGGKRCHDLEEMECVMSTLGSGAKSDTIGSGFYTVDDYKDILRQAQKRNIEVIPEFDMPGHSHAAIKAMRARRQILLDQGKSVDEAEEYLLDDREDPSQYSSVQMYDDNAVNPCMESTYNFIAKIYAEVKVMHQDIQPLKTYHFGGDEVAHGAWQDSPACQSLLSAGVNLKERFTQRVSDITKEINLAAWEDGLLKDGAAWKRDEMKNKDVIAITWDNVWEWGKGRSAHLLANAGYQVVLAPVTFNYFDMPQEPSPEERGFYWATRYTDIFKTFSFMPDDFYQNIDITRMGVTFTMEDVCRQHDGNGCPSLELPDNVIGMEACLWAETVRLPEQLDYMVFPRFFALAERAWHKAPWEGKPNKERLTELAKDQARFAKGVGSMHLTLLEKLDINYRVPPPGARQNGYEIKANTEFPGMQVVFKDRHSEWYPLAKDNRFKIGDEISLRTESLDGKRSSREVKVHMEQIKTNSEACNLCSSLPLIACIFLYNSFKSVL